MTWFLPGLFAVSSLYGANQTITTGYVTADVASASLALVLAAPLTGSFAAFQSRGYARFVLPLRVDRTGIAVIGAGLWPLLIGAPLTFCSAVLITTRAIPRETSTWALLALDALTILAAGLIGFAAARALPVVVAIPAVAVGLYRALTYGPSSDVPLLHYLTPIFGACCASNTQPAELAIRAMLLLTAVICLGIAAVFAPRSWARRSRLLVGAATILVLILGAESGAVLVASSGEHLTLQAVEPRHGSLSCRRVDGLPICLWPENRGRAGDFARIVGDLNPALSGVGLTRITGLTQAGHDPGAVPVEAADGFNADVLRYTVAAGYVDHLVDCMGAIGPARDQLVAFTSLLAGLSTDHLATYFGPGVVADAQAVVVRSRTHPRAVGPWFAERLRSVHCGRPG